MAGDEQFPQTGTVELSGQLAEPRRVRRERPSRMTFIRRWAGLIGGLAAASFIGYGVDEAVESPASAPVGIELLLPNDNLSGLPGSAPLSQVPETTPTPAARRPGSTTPPITSVKPQPTTSTGPATPANHEVSPLWVPEKVTSGEELSEVVLAVLSVRGMPHSQAEFNSMESELINGDHKINKAAILSSRLHPNELRYSVTGITLEVPIGRSRVAAFDRVLDRDMANVNRIAEEQAAQERAAHAQAQAKQHSQSHRPSQVNSGGAVAPRHLTPHSRHTSVKNKVKPVGS